MLLRCVAVEIHSALSGTSPNTTLKLFMRVCPHPDCDDFSSGQFAPLPLGEGILFAGRERTSYSNEAGWKSASPLERTL